MLLLFVFVVAVFVGARLGKRWLEKWKRDDIQKGIMVGLVITGFIYIREALVALSSA